MPCDLVKMGLTPGGVCKHRYGEFYMKDVARYFTDSQQGAI